MTENIFIREFEEKDIPAILELFSICFHKQATSDWFIWKYRHSPFGSKGYVAAEGGRIAAFYGGLKLSFAFMGKSLWAYQFCDVMTHPEYRGRLVSKTPLIVKIGEKFYEENPMDFAFGFPSVRHARLQALRLGGQGYRRVRLFTKTMPENIQPVQKFKVYRGWGFLSGEALERFSRIRRGKRFSVWSLRSKFSEDTMINLLKPHEYLTWRYSAHPLKKYDLFAFERRNSIKGYIVSDEQDGWIHVLEILCGNEKNVKELLTAFEAYIAGHVKRVKGLRMWAHPREPAADTITSLGYEGEESVPVAFCPVDAHSGVTPEIFYDRYCYRMGDYDAS